MHKEAIQASLSVNVTQQPGVKKPGAKKLRGQSEAAVNDYW